MVNEQVVAVLVAVVVGTMVAAVGTMRVVSQWMVAVRVVAAVLAAVATGVMVEWRWMAQVVVAVCSTVEES